MDTSALGPVPPLGYFLPDMVAANDALRAATTGGGGDAARQSDSDVSDASDEEGQPQRKRAKKKLVSVRVAKEAVADAPPPSAIRDAFNFWREANERQLRGLQEAEGREEEASVTGFLPVTDAELLTVDMEKLLEEGQADEDDAENLTYEERAALMANYGPVAASVLLRRPCDDETARSRPHADLDTSAYDQQPFTYAGHSSLAGLVEYLRRGGAPMANASQHSEITFHSALQTAKKHVVYVRRGFIEERLRSCLPGESPCIRGGECTGLQIDIANPFVLVQGEWPEGPRPGDQAPRLSDCWLCRLCLPQRTQMALLFAGAQLDASHLAVDFAVYTDVPGEFFTSDCQGPMQEYFGLVAPCPSVHLNQVEEVLPVGANGVRRLRLTLPVPTAALLQREREQLQCGNLSFFGIASCTLEGCIAGFCLDGTPTRDRSGRQ